MNLSEAQEGKEYIVKGIVTEDEELDAFLFSLGCYSGEPVTVISHRKGGCVVSLKDARYNMDTDLAQAILVYWRLYCGGLLPAVAQFFQKNKLVKTN